MSVGWGREGGGGAVKTSTFGFNSFLGAWQMLMYEKPFLLLNIIIGISGVSKAELETLSLLLEDRSFVDYFNIFLCLPVSPICVLLLSSASPVVFV